MTHVAALIGLPPGDAETLSRWVTHQGWVPSVIDDDDPAETLRQLQPTAVLVTATAIADASHRFVSLKRMLAATSPDTQFAVLAGGSRASYETAVHAMRVGVRDFAEYPLEETEIASLLRRITHRARLPLRVASVEDQVRGLVARMDELSPLTPRRT